jgi:TrmH family RNA methyltransferase
MVGRLRLSKSRKKEGLVLVEGVRAVTEALDAGVGGRFAVTSERLGQTSGGSALAARLTSTDLELNTIDDAELRALASTEHPQGVLLVCSEPRASLDLVEAGMRLLVLDGVQDPGNSGTLVRAAVAFGLDAVIVLEGTADPWGAKTVRASAGMAFRIPVIQARSGDTVAALRHAGVPLLVGAAVGSAVGAAVGAAVGPAVGELGRKLVGGDASEVGFALVVGNEGAGVRDELRDAATSTVSIPMPGPAESLNVAMAGSVLLYELTKESGA